MTLTLLDSLRSNKYITESGLGRTTDRQLASLPVLITAFLLLAICVPSVAQQPVDSVPSIHRDPVALAVVSQAIAAAGWTPASVPTSILASGTLTRTNDGAQQIESFTLKQLGPSHYRLDTNDNGVTTATVIKGLSGAIHRADGTKYRLPPHAAISMAAPAFPFFSDLTRTADPRVEVQDLGTVALEGLPCHVVSIARHATSDDKLARFRDGAAPLKVWISEKDHLLVRVDFVRLADDNPYVQTHFSRSFSDYRVVNGVAIAFAQEERVESQLMYQIQFSSVQFNSPFLDMDFDSSKL